MSDVIFTTTYYPREKIESLMVSEKSYAVILHHEVTSYARGELCTDSVNLNRKPEHPTSDSRGDSPL